MNVRYASQLSLSVFGVSVVGALFLLWPTTSLLGAEMPTRISLMAGDTVQVIEPAQFSSWFSLGQKTAFNPQAKREGELPTTTCSQFPFFCATFLPKTLLGHIVLESTFAINRDLTTQALLSALDELERDPINAKLGMGPDGELAVTAEAVPGLLIDRKESLDKALRELEHNEETVVELHFKTELLPAKVSRDTIAELGLHTKIAEGKTNFRGSPKNRIFNIHRAIEQYDGVVIPPGEEFSFVDYLGEVDGEHGYLPELVIKHNRTEPEFGGGICQVSTTVFRAALNAGLEITERRNHAYPVQYYKPYGMDATIYIPRPDLKFKNNTPGSILMLPKIVGTELTFTFYGTSDGRTTTIDGPHILESNPDGSMRTIFTQTVKDNAGNTFINATFPSNYKSPSLFPHPGDEILTEKPKNWSGKQWKEYKAIHP